MTPPPPPPPRTPTPDEGHPSPRLASWSGRASAELTGLVLRTFGRRCHICGLSEPPATTADHIIPRSKGGPDTVDNMRPAHKSCNSSRGARDLSEMIRPESGEAFFK